MSVQMYKAAIHEPTKEVLIKFQLESFNSGSYYGENVHHGIDSSYDQTAHQLI